MATRASIHDAPPVAGEALREALRGVATPVTVLTTMDGERPHGTTVSAFSSLSLEPPLVVVALGHASRLHGLIAQVRAFGINVLAHEQHELAHTFASTTPDRFAGVGWTRDHDLPRLDGAQSWFACRLHDLQPGGDHSLLLGEVVSAHATAALPLVYRARRFTTVVHDPA
jgi:flavin reductase (DIM6/NTAB) family NADH-FMN oxidoreductase RutF